MAREEKEEAQDLTQSALNAVKLAIGKYSLRNVHIYARWLTLRLDQTGFMIRHLTLLITKKWNKY